MKKNKNDSTLSVREKEAIRKNEGEPTRMGVNYSPAVDIYETKDAITLLADLPGVDKHNLDIHVEDKQLTITGLVDDQTDKKEALFTEYDVGGFTRSFRLGDTIDESNINAALKDGVLTLVLPKAEHLKPHKIQVTAS